MKNKTFVLGVLKRAAVALEELNDQVAYVGGVVVGVYADDIAADDVRPTKDIDLIVNISSSSKLEDFRKELAKKRIFPDAESKVICRFKFEDILIDVMSTKEIDWAPANPWFAPGFENLIKFNLDEVTIKILPVAYFLAAKFEAFSNRGRDARTSPDFEDIVYILDNRIELVTEINSSPNDVKKYLKEELKKLVENDDLHEAIIGHLYYETSLDRFDMIIDKLTEIIKSK